MEACVGSPWGAIANDIQDAPTCVRGCRDSLRRLLAPNDETFENFCGNLVRLGPQASDDMLIGLYCCDSQLCGVDNIGLPGFDPNVDFIINVCSSLGFDTIRDPGPPAATHVCVNTLLPSSDITCSRTTIPTTTTSSASTSQTLSESISTSTSTTSSTKTDSITSTSTDSTTSSTTSSSESTTPTSTNMTSTTGTGAAMPRITSLEDPKLSENIASGPRDNISSGLSTASKIIIVAAVSAAILLALIAVLWHCRYRRKNKAKEDQREIRKSLGIVERNTGSPTSQFSSPTPSYLGHDGEPLTPPPRLKDRRLLATGSSERLIERAPSHLRQGHQGFHLPTTSRGGTGSPYGSTVGPAVAMNAAAAGAALAADRYASATPASPKPVHSHGFSPTQSQFASISYASSLADPGPPPDRRLPSTPARSATTPSRSRSRKSVSPNAIGVALDFPPQVSDLSTQVSNESGSSESKIMTGPMAGATWRDSWVVSDDDEPAPLRSHRVTTTPPNRSPVMDERNLARMTGRY